MVTCDFYALFSCQFLETFKYLNVCVSDTESPGSYMFLANAQNGKKLIKFISNFLKKLPAYHEFTHQTIF